MDNKKLLSVEYQKGKKNKNVKIENHIAKMVINDSYLGPDTLNKIIYGVKFIHNNYGTRIPIQFCFNNIEIRDKLSYLIFECICNSLISDYKQKVAIKIKYVSFNIISNGFKSSALHLLVNSGYKYNGEFVKEFNSHIFKTHYRKIIPYSESNNEQLNQIMSDIFAFQNNLGIDYKCVDKISEVVVELIGNSLEHTKSDCLVDIDVSPCKQKTARGENVCGINITVINYSDILLGDKVKSKIKEIEQSKNKLNERYEKLLSAFEFHKNNYTFNYDEIDFFNIASFQHKISGRLHKYDTGGTGLTLLIKSIEEQAEEHSCYVFTGDRILYLDPKYLTYDEDEWLGFNERNDLFNQLPDKQAMERSSFFFPGTAYNLTFIMRVNSNEN